MRCLFAGNLCLVDLNWYLLMIVYELCCDILGFVCVTGLGFVMHDVTY